VPRAVERPDRVESAATASPEYETAEAQIVRRFGVTTATLLHIDRLPVLVGSRMLMALSRIIVSMLVALVALDARARDVLVIRGGTIIDTRTRQVLENHTVVVQDGRITKVGPAPEITTPLTAQVVDASSLWLFPGLIDMHVHGSSRSDVPLSLYVANGVTAVRDLGGPLTLLQRVRRELEAGTRVGPRLYFAGPLLDSDAPAVPTITIIANTRARAISAGARQIPVPMACAPPMKVQTLYELSGGVLSPCISIRTRMSFFKHSTDWPRRAYERRMHHRSPRRTR
jgi:hypothetical protein